MIALSIVLVVSLGTLLAIHVLGSVALARRSPGRGVAALVIPPLFVVFTARARLSGLAVAWCAAALAYGASLALALGWR